MPHQEWLEIPVFIHGITEIRYPHSPSKLFEILLKNVNKHLEVLSKPKFAKPHIMVEWGFEQSNGKDQTLAKGERILATNIYQQEKKNFDFPFFAMRCITKPIRDIFLYGLSDLFYYISEEGEEAVRNTVFGKLMKDVRDRGRTSKDQAKKVSLTIFAHSAGAIIAHDFLYNIFCTEKFEDDKKIKEDMTDKESVIIMRKARDEVL